MSKGREISIREALEKTEGLMKALGPQARIAGSLRRKYESDEDLDTKVKDVDVVVCRKVDVKEVEPFGTVMQSGDRKIRLLIPMPHIKYKKDEVKGLQVDIVMCEPEEHGACLMYLTGPYQYNVEMRAHAKGMGLKLNEKGLWEPTHVMVTGKDGRKKEYAVARWQGMSKSTRAKAKKVEFSQWDRIAGKTEMEVFKALGLKYTRPGARAELKTFADQVAWTTTVTGSKGDKYTVSLRKDGTWHCQCKGYKFTKKRPRSCSHIDKTAKPEYKAQKAA